MNKNSFFDSPAVNRLARRATAEATRDLANTPRDQLDPGNPNHPDNFDQPRAVRSVLSVAREVHHG